MIAKKTVQKFEVSCPVLWSYLARLDQIGVWNPQIGLRGDAAFNAEIRVVFKKLLSSRPYAEGPGRIVLFDPPRAIAWRITIPFFLQIDETFHLVANPHGVVVEHSISSSGLMARLAKPWLSRHFDDYLKAGDAGLAEHVTRGLPRSDGSRRRGAPKRPSGARQ